MSTLTENNSNEKQCDKDTSRQLKRVNAQNRVLNEDNSENVDTQCRGSSGEVVQ